MASITIIGIIEGIKYLPNGGGCFVFLSEYKKGYRKKGGEVVDDKFMSWKCIFKPGLLKYINSHFSDGMVVEVKGEVFPYAVEKGEIVDGYSVMGQTVNLFSIPRTMARMEKRMVKESMERMERMEEAPDLEGYNQSDF